MSVYEDFGVRTGHRTPLKGTTNYCPKPIVTRLSESGMFSRHIRVARCG